MESEPQDLERDATAMEELFLRAVDRVAARAYELRGDSSADDDELFFTVAFSRPEEKSVILTLSDEELVKAITSGIWAEFADSLDHPIAACIGIVRALVKCRAVFEEARLIRGDMARVYDQYLRRGRSGPSLTAKEIGEKLDLPEEEIDRHCSELFGWGLIAPSGDGYRLQEKYRLRVPVPV